MRDEPIIWEPGDGVVVGGALGRIEAIDRTYGYLVKMNAGHYVSAQRAELHPPTLFDAEAASRGDYVDPSKTPTENYLRIVK